jgi:hypothetical protein
MERPSLDFVRTGDELAGERASLDEADQEAVYLCDEDALDGAGGDKADRHHHHQQEDRE